MTMRTGAARSTPVLAPFGVSSQAVLDRVAAVADATPLDLTFIVPAGRPARPVEAAGGEVVSVPLARSLRTALPMLTALRRARRLLRAADGVGLLVDGSGWLAPYERLARVGARALGARQLVRVHADGAVSHHVVSWDPAGGAGAVLGNVRAYVRLRRSLREVAATPPPPRTTSRVARVLYLRADTGLVASDEPGGSRSHLEGVIGGFQDSGVTVLAATPRPVAAPRRSPPAHVPLTIPPLADLHGELGEAAIDAAVTRTLLDDPPAVDLVYHRYGLFAGSGLRLAARLGVPLVLEVNCSEVQFRKQYDAIRFARTATTFERELFSRASLVVAVSERAADEVCAVAPDARILVVPNGVDVASFCVDGDAATEARLRIGAEPRDVVVGFFGRFYKWHGIDVLVEAAHEFLSRRGDLRLLMTGDGPARDAAETGLAGWGARVTFTGIVPHARVPALMSACDILVAPHAPIAGFVGSPMKLFEYLASGRAVVASRLEQLAEVVEDDVSGVLVRPGDPVDLAQAVLRLAADPQLREHLGSSAHSSALERHSWSSRIDQVLAAVRQ